MMPEDECGSPSLELGFSVLPVCERIPKARALLALKVWWRSGRFFRDFSAIFVVFFCFSQKIISWVIKILFVDV